MDLAPGGLDSIRSSCAADADEEASRMPLGQRPSATVGVRSTPRQGDVASTHNRLRSHGHGRCLVSCRTLVVQLPVDTCRRRSATAETRGSEANRAVKQRGRKMENRRIEITRSAPVTPMVARGVSRRNRETESREACRKGRNSLEKRQIRQDPEGIALRGLTLTGSPRKFATGNLAPQVGLEPTTPRLTAGCSAN